MDVLSATPTTHVHHHPSVGVYPRLLSSLGTRVLRRRTTTKGTTPSLYQGTVGSTTVLVETGDSVLEKDGGPRGGRL